MKVKAIMIAYDDLKCISVDNTIEEALAFIEEYQLLSMPVVNKKMFVGVLSKQHIFEDYFRNYQGSKEEYLTKKVSELMHAKLVSVTEDTAIEEAAAKFIASKFRFIPVLNSAAELVGIVTQQAIFKEYQKLFGKDYDTFTIYSYDYKGTLAKITETIAKHNANIKNIVIINTETMGLQEFFVRVECKEFEDLTKALIKKGFDVRLNKKKV